jgi:hypothetical protein
MMKYNHPDAIIAARFAKASYDEEIPGATKIESEGNTVFVLCGNERTLVAFAGSNDHKDWMSNLQLELVPGPIAGNVHAGFLRGLSHIYRELIDIVPPDKPVTVIGHSRGGALAILYAAMRAQNHQDSTVYTFGAPRVGDLKFATNYDLLLKPNTFRFVNNNDLVTRIPQRVQGYEHGGTLCYFPEEGVMTHEITFWRVFLDRINGHWEDFGEAGLDDLKDHEVDDYVMLVEAGLSEEPGA